MKCIISIFILFFLFDSVVDAYAASEHQVIFSLIKSVKSKKTVHENNQAIHEATYELKKLCKKLYKNLIDTNNDYPHRSNSIFFIHFDHHYNCWTLYKPSFISYKEFIRIAKKIYAKHGLRVICHQDHDVIINSTNMQNHANYLNLHDFELYKNMKDENIQASITAAEQKNGSTENDLFDLEKLYTIQHMKKHFFWHLQIPTIGLMPGGEFDIDNQYKPLAWHFLLWDLAPKKGQGAHVAIIDTGVSAFNVQDKEYVDVYKKNINITAPTTLQSYGYNLVSKNGLDPIRQIAINFGHYCDHKKFDSNALMEKLPLWIIDLIKNKKNDQFRKYFIEKAKKEFLNNDEIDLNTKGEEKLQDLLCGKHGIMPVNNDPFFHVVQLGEPYNQEVLLETLPASKITSEDTAAGHGTFTQGIVNAQLNHGRGIFGLAPQAQVIMIKAFNNKGTTNQTILQAALQKAITLKNPIVSMSLKITDEFDKVVDGPLKELIDSIDYVIAASGNDGMQLQKEAYPAKFDSVAFDVGAFAYENGDYSVCGFTQKEINIGPKFIAPGSNIFSAGLAPDQTEDSMYTFMTGTSIATPIITGFMALVLAEFQQDFTREQILKVIYKFSMKLADDDVWKNYIKLGTPDMRSALLCLHVLKAFKQTLKNDAQYKFATHFDQLVQAVYTMNYYIPSLYEQKIGVSFTNNFSQFCKAVQEKEPASLQDCEFLQPALHSVTGCIDAITDYIAHIINSKKYSKKGLKDNKDLTTQLHTILFSKKFDLFAQASPPTKNRIKGAFAIKNACMID